MSCHRGMVVFRLILAPRCEFFTSWTKTERASIGGTYGLPINQVACEGVARGPLVWAFHLRVREDDGRAMNKVGGVRKGGGGPGVGGAD